jgi:Spy/CpxP family protein refolding chaperone
MMSKTPKVLAAVAVLSLLALPLAAQSSVFDFDAANSGTAGSAQYILTHPKALARYLGLSADQSTQLQTLWTTLQTAEKANRDARVPLCTALRNDVSAASPDPATVGTDSINLYNNKQQIRTARQTFDTSFTAILTPTQATKYTALKQIAHLDNGPGTDILGDCPPPAS